MTHYIALYTIVGMVFWLGVLVCVNMAEIEKLKKRIKKLEKG